MAEILLLCSSTGDPRALRSVKISFHIDFYSYTQKKDFVDVRYRRRTNYDSSVHSTFKTQNLRFIRTFDVLNVQCTDETPIGLVFVYVRFRRRTMYVSDVWRCTFQTQDDEDDVQLRSSSFSRKVSVIQFQQKKIFSN